MYGSTHEGASVVEPEGFGRRAKPSPSQDKLDQSWIRTEADNIVSGRV